MSESQRARYIGIKEIEAWPEANDKGEQGYAVVYPDGYQSWSPKEAFEEAYRPIPNMSFSAALEGLKRGKRAARTGWNGQNMFVFLVPGSKFEVNRPPLLGIYPEGTPIKYRPHIDMRTADGSIVTWVASQSDLISEDWVFVEDVV